MKQNTLFLAISLLFFTSQLFSQTYIKPTNWCESSLSDKQKDWLDHYQRNDALYHSKSKKNSTIYIPIKAHIVGKDDGTGYYSIEKLLIDICELNQRFKKDSIGFHFFLYDDIDYINNTSFYNDASTSNPMSLAIMSSSSHHKQNALNIFVSNAAPGKCGYYSSISDGILLVGGCCGSGSIAFTHEVAHYFNLPHTFEGWKGVWQNVCDTTVNSGMQKPLFIEKMDGSNCYSAGDGFCDTKPDYISYSWSCPYTCAKIKDPNGVLIHPDSSLYMSYASDYCTSRFSQEQVRSMQASLDTFHQYYKLNLPQNSTAITATPNIVLPITGATYPCDFVPIHWNKIIGAEKYLIAVYQSNNSSNQLWSAITTDTFTSIFASGNIAPYLNYDVKIMAFNSGNSCNSFSAPTRFSTSKALGVKDVNLICDFKIYPNPVNNYFIVNYVTSTNSNFTMTVNDISGREILSKIISSNNNSEVVETNTWAAGEYFVQLKDANNKIIKTEKVIVAK